MEDLSKLRQDIDRIDRQIVELFEERMGVSRQVAEYKIANGKKVLDRARELEKLETLGNLTDDSFNRHGIQELFQQIMAMSRKLQYQLLAEEGVSGNLPFTRIDHIDRKHCRVVYQGVEGAYAHEATLQYFGKDANAFHVPTWRDCMEAIKEGVADYAVLPIENSSAGEVNDIYDLLEEYENYIVGEQILKINHALLGLPGTSLDEIRTVYSHPQALMQCSIFLNDNGLKQISVENTAVAAKRVVKEGDKSQAAIASEIAGQLYGLELLKPSIQNNQGNTTRFVILANRKVYQKAAGKISLCFELPHTSGSLYNMLGNFIFNHVNMIMIESRPIPGKNWEYRFFVDIEGNLQDAGVQNALRGIGTEAQNFKILGNY